MLTPPSPGDKQQMHQHMQNNAVSSPADALASDGDGSHIELASLHAMEEGAADEDNFEDEGDDANQSQKLRIALRAVDRRAEPAKHVGSNVYVNRLALKPGNRRRSFVEKVNFFQQRLETALGGSASHLRRLRSLKGGAINRPGRGVGGVSDEGAIYL